MKFGGSVRGYRKGNNFVRLASPSPHLFSRHCHCVQTGSRFVTTMSCTFLPEILDLIVDHLRHQPAALKECCLASKSWVHRTRRHLFAYIEFCPLHPPIQPPSLLRTHSLLSRPPTITPADADIGSLVRTFHRVVSLYVNVLGWEDDQFSFISFHGLSPILRSST